MIETLALTLSLVPAVLFALNVLLFRRAPRGVASEPPSVSVLIPARNEGKSIEASLRSVLASTGVNFEVLVLDDGSEDDTAYVVQRIASNDRRVRLIDGQPLPPGWCGKQHACHALSQHARHDLMLFLDADVRLSPDALSRCIALLVGSKAELVSGFPRQETESFLERLLLPLIHFVLLGFLPLAGLRFTRLPAFAAGCGQLILVRRVAYLTAGGHAAIRASLHDGILLPRAFRSAGMFTDIFDGSDIAVCRMYRSAREVWFGLAKNAVEGMAAPGRIGVFTILLLGGQVLPFALLFWRPQHFWPAAAAIGLAYVVRLYSAVTFRQPVGSALLHPAGVLVLLAIQWYALARNVLRQPSAWKGRDYITGRDRRTALYRRT